MAPFKKSMHYGLQNITGRMHSSQTPSFLEYYHRALYPAFPQCLSLSPSQVQAVIYFICRIFCSILYLLHASFLVFEEFFPENMLGTFSSASGTSSLKHNPRLT